MAKPKRWFVKGPIFPLFVSLVLSSGALGQNPETPVTPPALAFNATPAKQLLTRGEAVVFVLEIHNGSEKPVFVSRLTGNELVKFSVVGPDGQEVPWQGEGRMDSKVYSAADFTVLQPYHLVSAERIISLKDGAGFVFDKPGQYSVTAEYSQGPAESLAPSAGEARIPSGSFRSMKTAVCIEVCILGPLPGQLHSGPSRAALDAVRVFYTYVTKYHHWAYPKDAQRKSSGHF
jgi:hypothetical protein